MNRSPNLPNLPDRPELTDIKQKRRSQAISSCGRRFVTWTELRNFFASRSLARQKKRLNQLSFAADDQFRKSFEPSVLGNFWLTVHPPQQETQLLGGNVALLDTVQ